MAAKLASEAKPNLKIGFVAFNRPIAEELQSRLSNAGSASTLHGLGYAAILKREPGCELEENKAERLLKEIDADLFFMGRGGKAYPTTEGKAVLALASKAKVTATDLEHEGAGKASALIRFFGIDQGDWSTSELAAVAGQLMQTAQQQLRTVDYDDMIWVPTVRQWAAGEFDLLFVDEAQDLGRTQFALARSAAPSGRLVVVGDRFQSINGFAGADPDSIPRIESSLVADSRGVGSKPLTVTFRCPHSHVALARKIVPHIEAAPWAIDGTVIHCKKTEADKIAEPGMLLLCRCTAPLVECAYRLIRDGKPAMVRGREIGKGLVSLINRLKSDTVEDLIAALEGWAEREKDRLRRRGASSQAIEAVEDKAECLGQLAAQCPTVDILRETIQGIFSDEGTAGKIVLSSVHRAKGLEAERVMILAPEKMPLRRKDQQPWEIQAEQNVLYVALTRSKRELIFAGERP